MACGRLSAASFKVSWRMAPGLSILRARVLPAAKGPAKLGLFHTFHRVDSGLQQPLLGGGQFVLVLLQLIHGERLDGRPGRVRPVVDLIVQCLALASAARRP